MVNTANQIVTGGTTSFLNLGPAPNIQNGTAITYDGSTAISLAPNQIYQATYKADVESTAFPMSAVAMGFQGVAGSQTNYNVTTGQRLPITNTVLVDSNVNPTLRLFGGVLAGSATFNNLQVTVVKVA
jgi:hypothetical protein